MKSNSLFVLLIAAVVGSSACDRSESAVGTGHGAGPASAPPPHRAGPPAAPVPAGAQADAQVAPRSPPEAPAVVPLSARLSWPAADRLVAIGDLHGDLEATRRAFRLAGAIDEADRWIGGTLVLVQTGDAIDRGDQDRGVLVLLERLQKEAALAGGKLILLNGNHELMNVALDFRYVTTVSLDAFSSEGGRASAFSPGGPFAKQLAEQPIVAKVGDSLFVHGGVLAKHVRYGLDRMNDEVRAWMLGELPAPPDAAVAADGVLWTRLYSTTPRPEDCEQLRGVLVSLGAKRMVVGHTVQLDGITSACEQLVWRIDVGLASFYGGPTEVLEIKGDEPRILRAQDEKSDP